jgi:D-3-phosphoglycerate dehydrogenase
MSKYTVVISDSPFPSPQPFLDTLKEIDCEIIFADLNDKAGFEMLCEKADGMIVTYAEINAAIINQLTKCRILARTGVAVNNIDLNEATKKKIYVTNVVTPQILEVAKHAITLLLTSVKKIVLLNNNVKKGIWNFNAAVPIYQMTGKTLGLAGFGNIAKEVAKIAKILGLNVIAYDPYVKQEVFAESDVLKVEFSELIKVSDYISIHMPLTEETKDLFNTAEFDSMKQTAYIINTSRGGIINEDALIEAIDKGKIAGAGLDVLSTEFPGEDHPLFKYPNVIITPHSAYYSEECVENLQKSAAHEIVRVLKGEKPLSLVNKELLID